MREIREGQFIVLICFPNSVDWQLVSVFDPDQELEARGLAEKYLGYGSYGFQVAVAQIFCGDVKEATNPPECQSITSRS